MKHKRVWTYRMLIGFVFLLLSCGLTENAKAALVNENSIDGSGGTGNVILTVLTDQASYNKGDTVVVTASITRPDGSIDGLEEMYPDAWINAVLLNASGEEVPNYIVQGSKGLEAVFHFPLSDDNMLAGQYKVLVEASIGGLSKETDLFSYTAIGYDIDVSTCDIDLTLNTESLGFCELFQMKATVTDADGLPVKGVKVFFYIYDEDWNETDFFGDYGGIYNLTKADGSCFLGHYHYYRENDPDSFPAGHYNAYVYMDGADYGFYVPFEFTGEHSSANLIKRDELQPTCTEDGYQAYWLCTACGALYADANMETQISEPVTISATGHDWSEELSGFSILDNDQVSAHRVCRKNAEHLLPVMLNTISLPKSVSAIEEDAFNGSKAEAVIIPESCRIIEKRAFANCSRLQYVYIEASETDIAKDAFANSPNVRIEFGE